MVHHWSTSKSSVVQDDMGLIKCCFHIPLSYRSVFGVRLDSLTAIWLPQVVKTEADDKVIKHLLTRFILMLLKNWKSHIREKILWNSSWSAVTMKIGRAEVNVMASGKLGCPPPSLCTQRSN